MPLRLIALLATVAVALATTTAAVSADGVVVPQRPCPDTRSCPQPCPGDEFCPAPYLPIRYHRVAVTMKDQVAEVRVDQAFANDGDLPLEATYMFPLAVDAAVSDFTMTVDGQQLEARLLDRDEARAIYERIVRERRDPALLEYVDRGVFQTSVFPIPPHSERRIQIGYTQVAPRDNDLVRFVYPLSTEKFSPAPIPEVSISVDIESTQPMRSIYSPTHDVAIDRKDDHHATVSMEQRGTTPRADFELLYSTSSDDIGASVRTYRTGDDAGYFLLLVAPGVNVDPERVQGRDVVVVLDTSGSMQGEKLDQGKQAARDVVNRLNAGDRFAVMSFDSSVLATPNGLRPAREGRNDALRFIDGLSAAGSTNIHDALLTAVGVLAGGARPSVVIFITDGLPTVGITDPQAIASDLNRDAPARMRLFTFGVGYDVNTLLLDQLAQEHAGGSEYVRPEEDVATVVSRFYERISDPVLSDIALDFGGADVFDVYPNPLPDLFAGSQLVLAGRYRGAGTFDVTLTGSVEGQRKRYEYHEQPFPERAFEASYVPRLWAARKIGFLLNSVRFGAPPADEVVQEIVALSKRFGIITPYTSFIVDEPDTTARQNADAFKRDAVPNLNAAAGAPSTGASAFDTAREVGKLKAAESLAPVLSGSEDQLRAAGDRTFLLSNDVWTDSTYAGGATEKIGFGEDAYFEVLRRRPDWAPYFALGERVIFVSDGRAYEIAPGDFPSLDVPAAGGNPKEHANHDAVAAAPAAQGGDRPPWAGVAAGAVAVIGALVALAALARTRRRSSETKPSPDKT